MSSLEIVTTCFGSRFRRGVDGWAAHLRRLTPAPITVLSLDGEPIPVSVPNVTVVRLDDVGGRRWGDADLPRLEHIIAKLEAGATCIQIDLDIYLKRWIDPMLELDYDFIISREVSGSLSYPIEMGERHGFTACCGFYIARPAAIDLCRTIATNMREGLFGENQTDQRVLNLMLLDSDWTSISHLTGSDVDRYSETKSDGARICVLDERNIARDYRLGRSRYGNHVTGFVDLFARPWLMPDQPAGRLMTLYLEPNMRYRNARKRWRGWIRPRLRRARSAAGRLRRRFVG